MRISAAPFAVVFAVVVAGCAELPAPVNPAQAEVTRARWVVWQRDQQIAALEAENQALSAELEERSRSEAPRVVEREAAPTSAPAPEPAPEPELDRGAALLGPVLAVPADASAEELARLREQLLHAGFGGVTLNAAQVRALLKSLRPTRPIDETSPFAL